MDALVLIAGLVLAGTITDAEAEALWSLMSGPPGVSSDPMGLVRELRFHLNAVRLQNA